jgi:hypothetical protein
MSDTQTARTHDITYGLGVSPESTVLYSYRVEQITLAEIDHKWTWYSVHPEMRRRVLAAWFSHPATVNAGNDAQGRPILHSSMGIGSGGRSAGAAALRNFWSRYTQTWLPGRPSRSTPEGRAWLKKGFSPLAYPGNSIHETDAIENAGGAIDMLGWQDMWFEGNCHRFGIDTFSAKSLGSEWWHTHFADWPKTKSAFQASYRGGRRIRHIALPVFGPIVVEGETCDCAALVPVEVPVAPKPIMPVTNFAMGLFGLWPFNSMKKDVSRKLNNSDSSEEYQWTKEYAQAVLRKTGHYRYVIDGDIGKRSGTAIRAFQRANRLKPDGLVGKVTWAVIDRHAG